jgi:RNA polymerase sigma factor (sigma-70 family)
MGKPMKATVVSLHRAPSDIDRLSDEALVAACAVGEPLALGALFDRFHPRLYRFVSRMIGASAPDVDDLVQATFFEVWRSAARFRGQSAPLTWMFGIAANLTRHHIRSEQRRAAAVLAVAERPSPPSPDISEAAAHRQAVERMAAAMEELPHHLKTAFVLCDLEGIRGVEAARALDVRPGTFWRRLHEARKALRATFEKETP